MTRIAYSNFNGTESWVEYDVFPPVMCVFTGITSDGTSTINAAESIVKAISAEERKPLRFYDLTTKCGYAYYRMGEYSFNLLTLSEREDLEVIRWEEVPMPDFVFKEFRTHIGPNPRVRKHADLAGGE